MRRYTSARIFSSVIAVVGWFALILQLYVLIDNTPGNGLTPLQAVGRFFIFFTILTDLLVTICATALTLQGPMTSGNSFSNASTLTAVAVYIFIVGLVYNLILRQLWQPTGMQQLADELLHVALPILFVVYWIFFVTKGSLRWKHLFAWLVFPLLYLIYALIRGSLEGFYPYPFLDLNQLSTNQVILNCLGLTLAFLVAGLLFFGADKLIRRNKSRDQ